MAPRTFPNCEILRVIDGDTLEMRVDHGWTLTSQQHIRLAGLNAPELRSPGGPEASDAVRAWVKSEGSTVTIETDGRDKFGRYLARVIARSGRDLGADLIGAGHAVRWNGRGARP